MGGLVQNEKRQRENQPYGRVFRQLVENTYPTGHPYSWSTIGSMEHLDAATLDDVKTWLKTYDAAAKKDAGQRVDLEAGMAKLFASEVCGEVTLEAMRVHGGYGYLKDFPVERYYRDAPLMIIGEGTNEIQKLIIARRLLEKYKI